MPLTMPKLSRRTLATGARQLVVHEAFGDDVMFVVLILVLVDAERDCDVRTLAGAERSALLAPPTSMWCALLVRR